MKKKLSLTITVIIVVIILLIVCMPTKLSVEKAEVSHRTINIQNMADDRVDFVLSNEDVAAFEKIIKNSHMRFRGNVLKLGFEDYVDIQINDTTRLSIGIETTKYKLRSGHYVFLIQDGKFNKATFMNNSSYKQLVRLLNKYDDTISVTAE